LPKAVSGQNANITEMKSSKANFLGGRTGYLAGENSTNANV